MLRVLALLLLASSSASAQTDSLRTLPPFSRTFRGDFQPPQTSTARAYAYSAGATGALVGAGTLLVLLSPDRETDAGGVVTGIGGALIVHGILLGPTAGHLSLGAGSAVERSVRGKLYVLGAGAGIATAGVVLVFAGSLASGRDALAVDVGEVLAIGGVGLMAAGAVGGVVYDLATIPASARWAREARAAGNRVPVTVSPAIGLRRGAPVLGLRARF